MKKFKFKTRMQWGWFKAALIGTGLAVLLTPALGRSLGITNVALKQDNHSAKKESANKENPVSSLLGNISFGSKVKVIINGDIVALAKSEEAGAAAFKEARLAYNKQGVRILDIDVEYEEVDKEKDADRIKGMRVLKDEALTDKILASLETYEDKDKELAYTMRIDDYTVTVDSMENLVAVLEQAQGQYDTENRFQVNLVEPQGQNVQMYEVGVSEKEADSTEESKETSESAANEASEESQTDDTENVTSEEEQTTSQQDATETGGVTMLPSTKVGLTGKNSDEQAASNEENSDEKPASGEENSDEKENEQDEEKSEEDSEKKEDKKEQESNSEVAAQAANDGVKYVGFSENIQVMQTYVDKSQIKDKETTYTEITEQKDEPDIYVVEPGDYLDLIAKKNNMTVEQIKELNPGIESDENLYYDDRLNVTVPTAAVQILVKKQETYEETYYEDVVYEDDADMYIGETEVVQEGTEGKHIVTDLVTYKNDIESDREQLEENVEVAAVAQIVKRGTKSKPTYMYPVTNWNVTSNFGYRWGRLHAGTDVGVPVGTTVRASRAGKVITAGWVGGYGNCVMIDHGDGVWTVYGHLSEFSTSVGSYVEQGEQIALSGNTGRSTGPHLHFEIRVNGSATDATPYLEGTAN